MEFKLREIRTKKHLTMKQLADLSGVNETTIRFLETGINNPNDAKISTLVKLATALKCKVRNFYPCENHI